MNEIRPLTGKDGGVNTIPIDLQDNAMSWEEVEEILISRSHWNEPGNSLEQIEAKLLLRSRTLTT